MLRRLLRDGLIYGVSTILARAIGLILLPVYTRLFAPRDYGAIDMMAIVAGFLAVTVTLEIAQGMARLMPDAPSDEAKIAYGSTTLSFTIAIYFAVALVFTFFDATIARALLGTGDYARVVATAGWSIAAAGVFYALQNLLKWDLKPMPHAVSTLVFSIVSIAVTLFALLVVRTGVVGVFQGQLAGNLAAAATAAWFARDRLRLSFSSSAFREMTAFSLPLVPASVSVLLSEFVDRMIIRQLLPLTELGIYGVAMRLASIAGLLLLGFQAALTPLVLAHHREEATPRELARLFRWFVAAAGLACIALSIFSRDVVHLIATAAYAQAAPLLPLLAPAVLLAGMYIFAPGLLIAKKTRVTAIISGGTAILNAALNYAMIPLLGIRGSALATLTASLTGFVALMILSQREYPLPIRWRAIMVSTVLVLAAAAAGPMLPTALPHNWTLLAAKAAMVTLAAVIAVLSARD